MGKGSNRRVEDTQKIRDNWDLIFGKKDQKEEKKEEIQQKSQENTVKTETK